MPRGGKRENTGIKPWVEDSHKVELFIEAIKRGHSKASAGNLCGISGSAVSQAFKRGEEEFDKDIDSAYSRMYGLYLVAKEEMTDKAISAIRQVIDWNNWQASAWWLERTDPDRFALKRDNTNLSDVAITIKNDVKD